MKRLIKLTILLLTCFVSSSVFAASVNVSATSANVYVGDTASFKVTVVAGTWNLSVSGAASDKIVGFDMDGNVTTNKTYAVDTSRPGTYTITVTGDITDYDTDKNSAISKTATITVSNRPNNPTPTTQPTPQTTRTTTTKKAATQTQPQAQPTQPVVEEPTTVVVEEPTEVVTETVVKVNKIKIVGYDFKFDPNKYSYDLNIGNDVDELYIMVDGEDIEVEGQGIVDIKDKNSFTITVKSGDKTLEYKFNLIKGSVLGVQEVSNNTVIGFKKALITLSLVTLLITCISLYYFVLNKKSI